MSPDPEFVGFDDEPYFTTLRVLMVCAIAIVVSFALAALAEWLR